METKIIKLYENYGVLAHEYESAFSATAAAEIHDEIYVELPHVVGETICGEPVVELDGMELVLRCPGIIYHNGKWCAPTEHLTYRDHAVWCDTIFKS